MMQKWRWAFVWGSALIVSLYFAYFVGTSFPRIGHDFRYYLPRLVDVHLHYVVNGLSVQWYTASFGAGLPAYPHPSHLQFSFAQLYTWFVNPWLATQGSFFTVVLIGFLASYYFFARILDLNWQASVLGAVFFCANGFNFGHMGAGHLNHNGLPLMALLMVGLFHRRLPPFVAGSLAALAVGLLVYSANYYPMVFILMSVALSMPILYLLKPALFDKKRLWTIVWGGVLGVGLSLSKLYAVYAFMRFFPREVADVYKVGVPQALVGMVLQLLGVMNMTPTFWVMGIPTEDLFKYLQTWTGNDYGLWETDLSLSPVLIGVLVLGGLWVGRSLFSEKRGEFIGFVKKHKWVFLILLILIEITIEMTLAKGFIFNVLKELPVLRSLHVHPRFASAFIFPLCLLGAVLIHHGRESAPPPRARLAFLVMHFASLLLMSLYLLIPIDRLQRRSFDATSTLAAWKGVQEGERFPVEVIYDDLRDARVFDQRGSNLNPYETIFGYGISQLRPLVHPGPVWEVTEGYFNMTNPTSLVYPDANGTTAFERISVYDWDKMEAFVNHRQPAWKLPLAQQIANWVSVICLVIVTGTLGYASLKQFRVRPVSSMF